MLENRQDRHLQCPKLMCRNKKDNSCEVFYQFYDSNNHPWDQEKPFSHCYFMAPKLLVVGNFCIDLKLQRAVANTASKFFNM